MVERRGQAHELAVDTPQVAHSFVSSLPVSGGAESWVERVSHWLATPLQDPIQGVGGWPWGLELGDGSERPGSDDRDPSPALT